MRTIILLLGLLFQLNNYAQNFSEVTPQLIEFKFKDAQVNKLSIPFLNSSYHYDTNGYMIKSTIEGIFDSLKLVKQYSYDNLNKLFVVKNETFSNDNILGTHTKRYLCTDFNRILNSARFDFMKDSRFDIRDYVNDTLYIFRLKCLDNETTNEKGWYSYDTIFENDPLLFKIVVITNDNKHEIKVSYINPDSKKTLFTEIFEFDENRILIRRINKYNLHTEVFKVLTKKGAVVKELSHTMRKNEDFTYSLTERKYKYDKLGLLTKQSTKTRYLIQGHSTKSVIDLIYEF